MSDRHVFISVGSPFTDAQESFVCAVEDRLRSEGLIPHTVGRNHFSADAPLKAIIELMDTCVGAVVIALERTYVVEGVEKRGGSGERSLHRETLPTPWNQIEAAMAYSRNLPLLVIVEEGLKSEGLLERGYDWWVQWVHLDPASLSTVEFNGVLRNWITRLADAPRTRKPRQHEVVGSDLATVTIGDLVKSLKPGQFWSVLGALTVVIGGAFALGGKLVGGS